MMLSEALNSDTIFNELKEVAQGPLLPQGTAVKYPIEPQQSLLAANKHSLLQQNADASMPPSKRVCTSKPFHRIPCKARGLSNKHNSDTAFFDIPVDAPHGLLLSCSHTECAESGRRFRYCKVCALPVAKRNFPKRHGHGLIHSAKDLKEVDYMCGFIDNVDDDGTCQPCDEDSSTVSFAASAVVSGASMIQPNHRRVVSFDASKRAAAAAQAAMLGGRPAPVVKSFYDLNSNEKEWLQLLHQRPDLEQDAMMSSWMDKIISFSEEKGSIRGESQFATMTTAMEQQSQQNVAPVSSQPMQHLQERRDSTVTPIPEPAPVHNSLCHMEQTASSPTIMPTHSVSPSSSIEGQLNGLATDVLDLPEPSGVKQMMRILQHQASEVSEFVSGLDNVDMTNFFD